MCLFREPFALNHYKERNPTRPALLCPTSQKYAFSRYNRTSAHIIFVGGQQETAVHVFASTCTDRCPLLALSGQSIRVYAMSAFGGKSGHRLLTSYAFELG